MKSAACLPNFEIRAYFIFWCTVVGYSIYNVYLISDEIHSYNLPFGYFDEGWGWVGRAKDIFDHEWIIAIKFMYSILIWLSVHVCFSEVLRQKKMYKFLPIWYATLTLCYSLRTFHTTGTLLLLIQPSITITAIIYKSKKLLWLFSILMIILMNGLHYFIDLLLMITQIDEDSYYMLMISFSWMTLKCISCGLDIITKNTMSNVEFSNEDLKNLIGYTMYFPTLLFGPIQIYYEFEKHFRTEKLLKKFKIRLFELTFNLFRFFFWYLFTEFSLHFIYVNVLQNCLEILVKSSWAVYGLGYCMGQFFHLKYIVIYGLTTSIMKAEEINTPSTPVCIGYIHLYSYMWKYFDCGLYRFLVRYIYLPSGGGYKSNSIKRLLSSFLCFCFVFIWHGTQMFVLIWSLFNFIGVTVENMCKKISSNDKCTYNMNRFSASSLRRINAIVSSPLMIMSALSNFFFLGGLDVGYFYVHYVFTATFKSQLILFICVYTLCQLSIEISTIRNKNSKKS